MNILFLTIVHFESIEAHSIYADLLRCFRDHGHTVYVVSPYEKRLGKKTELVKENGAYTLHVQTGNVTNNANLIEKGLSQLSLEPIYIRAIKTWFADVKFDLVLYSTPPITFCRAVEFVKRRDGARSYLLLKDIFPQNAVDIGLMTTQGVRGLIYRFFRRKEKKLYAVSDRIGCMSQANVDYVLAHNPEVDPEIVEICPNSIEVEDKSIDAAARRAIREKHQIPQDKTVFIYGGNLGKPQGIPFVIECLKRCRDLEDAYFLIVGSGTEYPLLADYARTSRQKNLKLMERIPKEDYDTLVAACDVGLIFLDHRFTIPNFPSRLLGYMQAKLPVLACTDPNTDIGKVIVDGGFGWWCESNDADGFAGSIREIAGQDLYQSGNSGFAYLNAQYAVDGCVDRILARGGQGEKLSKNTVK